MFNLSFTSSEYEDPVPPRTSRGGKRSRRRRNAKYRKSQVEPMAATEKTPKKHHDAPMTKSDIYFALDCEMVGVGPQGLTSVVARVTIVNWENQVVLDTFVKVPVPVTDYRTHISGITAQDIQPENAVNYEQVRSAVKDIIHGKILIGHGLENDLTALGLVHPWCDVRDTACYPLYMREIVDPSTGKLLTRPRKLRDLAWEVLGRQIQHDGIPHCPIDDAIASLDLYKAARFEWEHHLGQQQREVEKPEGRFKYNFFWNSPIPGLYGPVEPHNVYLLPIPIDPRLAHPYPYDGYPGYSPMPASSVEMPALPPLTSSSPSSWFRFVLRPKTPPPAEGDQEEKRALEDQDETTTPTEEEAEMEPINVVDLETIDPRLAHPYPYAGYPEYSPMPTPSVEMPEPLPLTSSSPSSWFRFVLRPKTPPPAEGDQEEKKALEDQDKTGTPAVEEAEMEPINVEDLETMLPDVQYLSLESQESSTDSVISGGLPFYSKSSIWGQG